MIRRAVASIAALAMLSVPIPCLAAKGQDFGAVVAAMETQYGVHHMHIPLLGFATLCVRVAGAPGLKIAVFEHAGDAKGMSPDSLADTMQAVIGPAWHLLVRVREKGQFTIIFTNATDKKLKALIVCLDGEEATVVEAGVKVSQLQKWMRDPEEARDLSENGL